MYRAIYQSRMLLLRHMQQHMTVVNKYMSAHNILLQHNLPKLNFGVIDWSNASPRASRLAAAQPIAVSRDNFSCTKY